jgi:C1A family cysteine protease
MPPVYDQGDLGSCTANAIAAVLDTLHVMDNPNAKFINPSRLFIYYYERVLGGDVADDSGASLRDGMKVVNSQGACMETTWPYDITQFAVQPLAAAIAEALNYEAILYERVPLDLLTLKSTIALKLPIVCGIQVYDSFESGMAASTGIIPMPDADTEQLLGGHAIVLMGYDDVKQVFVFRNSWSAAWGNGGYGTLPYAYVQNPSLTSDTWAIQKAE